MGLILLSDEEAKKQNLNRPLSFHTGENSEGNDVSLVHKRSQQQTCAFCQSLKGPGVRTTNRGKLGPFGTLEFEGSCRTKTEVEQAARMECFRCELILDGVTKCVAPLHQTDFQDFIVYDHVKLADNGNAMGVQVVSRPDTANCKVLDLVFHVTSLGKGFRHW